MISDEDHWWVKLARAAELNGQLRDAVESYLRTGVEVTWSYDEREQLHLARLTMPAPPPPRLGAIVGDMVKNIRSALDSRVYAILAPRCVGAGPVGDAGTAWRPNARRIFYPVTESSADFHALHKGSWHQGVADPKLMHDIEVTQSYWVPSQGTTPLTGKRLEESIEHDWITTLSRLSNQDKHHAVPVTVSYVDMIWIGTPDDTPVQFLSGDKPPFRDGDLIIRAKVAGDPKHVHPSGYIGVALEDDWGFLHGTSAVDRCAGLIQRAHWVMSILHRY